jgi:hypothetical protein
VQDCRQLDFCEGWNDPSVFESEDRAIKKVASALFNRNKTTKDAGRSKGRIPQVFLEMNRT